MWAGATIATGLLSSSLVEHWVCIVLHARERWATLTNEMLARRGRDERVDHRSHERQGIDLEPGRHYGPAAALGVANGLFEPVVVEASRGLPDGNLQPPRADPRRRRTRWRLSLQLGCSSAV
jgi:MobA/MobL family protein